MDAIAVGANLADKEAARLQGRRGAIDRWLYPRPARPARSATRAGGLLCLPVRRKTRTGLSYPRDSGCPAAPPRRLHPAPRACATGPARSGIDSRVQPRLPQLTEHHGAKLRHVQGRRPERDQRLRFSPCGTPHWPPRKSTAPAWPAPPGSAETERAHAICAGRPTGLPGERDSTPRTALSEILWPWPRASWYPPPAIRSGRRALRSKHQSAQVLATRLRTRSLPRSLNSRRRTTSLISDSSMAIRSRATRRTTLVMRSCHCWSQSVISTWLRGRLMTAAARVAPGDGRPSGSG